MYNLIIINFLAFILLGCGGGSSDNSTNLEEASPIFKVSKAPINPAIPIHVSKELLLTFSDDIDFTSINSPAVQLFEGYETYLDDGSIYIDYSTSVAINIKQDSSNAKNIILSPQQYLTPQTSYRVIVSTALKNTAGLSLSSEYIFDFSTSTDTVSSNLLSLLSTNPKVETSSADVSTKITFLFNNPISNTTLDMNVTNSSLGLIAGNTVIENNSIIFTPDVNLIQGEAYEANFDGITINDVYGGSLSSPSTFFTVAEALDDIGISVLSQNTQLSGHSEKGFIRQIVPLKSDLSGPSDKIYLAVSIDGYIKFLKLDFTNPAYPVINNYTFWQSVSGDVNSMEVFGETLVIGTSDCYDVITISEDSVVDYKHISTSLPIYDTYIDNGSSGNNHLRAVGPKFGIDESIISVINGTISIGTISHTDVNATLQGKGFEHTDTSYSLYTANYDTGLRKLASDGTDIGLVTNSIPFPILLRKADNNFNEKGLIGTDIIGQIFSIDFSGTFSSIFSTNAPVTDLIYLEAINDDFMVVNTFDNGVTISSYDFLNPPVPLSIITKSSSNPKSIDIIEYIYIDEFGGYHYDEYLVSFNSDGYIELLNLVKENGTFSMSDFTATIVSGNTYRDTNLSMNFYFDASGEDAYLEKTPTNITDNITLSDGTNNIPYTYTIKNGNYLMINPSASLNYATPYSLNIGSALQNRVGFAAGSFGLATFITMAADLTLTSGIFVPISLNSAITNDANQTFTIDTDATTNLGYTLLDASLNILYSSSVLNGASSYAITLPDLTDGTYTVSMELNATGISTQTIDYNLTIDTISQNTVIFDGVDGDNYLNIAELDTIFLSGTKETGGKVTDLNVTGKVSGVTTTISVVCGCTVNDINSAVYNTVKLNTYTSTDLAQFDDGNLTTTVTSYDIVSNSDINTSLVWITKDTVVTDTTSFVIDADSNGSISVGETIDINGTVEANSPLGNIIVKITDTALTSADVSSFLVYDSASGVFGLDNYDSSNDGFVSGDLNVTLDYLDIAGNPASSSTIIYKD